MSQSDLAAWWDEIGCKLPAMPQRDFAQLVWEACEARHSTPAMTDAQRRQLRPGDRVLVRLDDGSEVERVVRTEPWQLGHGAWVIGLRGIAGGYLLDRVVRLIQKQGEQQ